MREEKHTEKGSAGGVEEVAQCCRLHMESMADGDCTERYFELLKDTKVKGYLFAQQNFDDMSRK